MTKFLKHFKRTIKEAATPAIPADVAPTDEQAFSQTFDSKEDVNQVNSEMDNLALDPQQKAEILHKADKYAEFINKSILPTLRKLHDDFVGGTFTSITPEIKGLASICEDLAGLSESLRGRVRDAVIKSDKNEKKQP